MARKFTDALLDHASELLATHTVTETARQLGVNADRLSQLLRARGVQTRGVVYRPSPNARDYPRDRVAALHAEGWSVKRIAKEFNVCRATVRAQLLRDGIQPRDRSSAMFARMAVATDEQRKELTRAAHERNRGEHRSIETKQKLARSRTKRVGPGEQILAEALTERDIAFEPQAPIHIYNVDLLVGSVAVEPSVKPRGRAVEPKWVERTKYLLEHA